MAVTYSGPMTIKEEAGPPAASLQYYALEQAEDNPMQQFVAPEYALKSTGGGAVSVGGGMPYGDDATNLASLFDSLNQISAIRERAGGGTGGGTQKFEGNMDMNKLIALNPYMEKNVTSFANGGEMEMDNQYMYGGKHTKYNQGGMYERAANQAIAQNQLSGLIANAINKRMPMAPPIASKGMKMRKRYTNGGRF